MAKVTVEGVVASVNGTGTGFRVEEGYEIDGKWFRRFYSCWFPKTASVAVPNQGDRVTVRGTLSAKVSTRDARFVDLTVNNTVIIERSAAGAVQESRTSPESEQPPEDPWGPVTPIPNDQDVPF